MGRRDQPRRTAWGRAVVVMGAGALLGCACGVFDTPDSGVRVAPATEAPTTDERTTTDREAPATTSAPPTEGTIKPHTVGLQHPPAPTERIPEDPTIPAPVVDDWTFTPVAIPEESGPSWAAWVDPIQQPFSGAAAFHASTILGDAQVLVLRADPATVDGSTPLVTTLLLHREGLAAGLEDGTTVEDSTTLGPTVVQGRGGIEAWNAWYSDGFAYVVQAGTERTVETLTAAMIAAQGPGEAPRTVADVEGDLAARAAALAIPGCSILSMRGADADYVQMADDLQADFGIAHIAVRAVACDQEIQAALTLIEPPDGFGVGGLEADLEAAAGADATERDGVLVAQGDTGIMWFADGVLFALDALPGDDGEPVVTMERLDELRRLLVPSG